MSLRQNKMIMSYVALMTSRRASATASVQTLSSVKQHEVAHLSALPLKPRADRQGVAVKNRFRRETRARAEQHFIKKSNSG
jgi:hypothetical protein